MKNHIIRLSILLFISCYHLQAQSLEQGSWQFKVSRGIFVGKSRSSMDFNKINSNGIGLTNTQASIHYNTRQRFSLGLNILDGYSKSSSPSDTATLEVNTGGIGFNVQYYFVNRPKLNIYIDIMANAMNIELFYIKGISAIDYTIEKVEGFLYGKGNYHALGVGLNKYFGRYFGIFAKTGWNIQNYRFLEFTINNVKQEKYENVALRDYKISASGLYAHLGLTVKLHPKAKKNNEN